MTKSKAKYEVTRPVAQRYKICVLKSKSLLRKILYTVFRYYKIYGTLVQLANRSLNKPVRSANKRFAQLKSLCAQRTSGAVTEQACVVSEQAVRSSNKPVWSANKRFGHRTSLCGQRTSGAVTAEIRQAWNLLF